MATWVLLSLNFALASFSALMAIMAARSLRALRRRLAERSTRSLLQLDTQVANLESSLSSMSTTLRRLSSRQGMQDLRARRKVESAEQMPMNLSPAERKAWLRKEIAKGNLIVVKDPTANS